MKSTVIFAAALAVFLSAAPSPSPAAPAGNGRVRVEVFFESMDGPGWQWFFLGESVRRRLPGVDFAVYPLLSKNEKGEWEARRGEAEIAESMRIAVMGGVYPDKQPAYLNARSLSPWAEGWRDAAVFSGVPPVELAEKAGKSGPALMEKIYKKAQSAGITGAAILINGEKYAGGPKILPLLEAVTGRLPAGKRLALPKAAPAASAPAKQAAAAKPPKFWVILASGVVKNDALVGVFDNKFPGIQPVVLDYDSPERAKEFPELDFVPAYALEGVDAVKKELAEEIKAGIFTERDGRLFYFDKQGRGIYAGRKPEPGLLELFVMSQCPYGVTAENGLIDAIRKKELPDKVRLRIHYIGDSEKGEDGKYSFKSLHGTPEWEENVRQLIIAKKFPDKFNDYLLERNLDVTSTQWDAAAKKAGLDPREISSAFEDGKALLAEDFAYSSSLGMGTSPSFLWEGRTFVVGMGDLAKLPGFEKVTAKGSTGAGCAK